MSSDITIDRLGHHGDGIAPGPIYAARTLPGEVISGPVSGDRVEAPRILEPSADRVRPPCRHYRGCGGCALQHASDNFVTGWKARIVKAALSAHGLSAPFRPMAISPPQTRRRAVFSGRRTKQGALVGFHVARSDVITAVPDCTVLSSQMRAVLPALEAITRAGAGRKTLLRLAVTGLAAGCDVAVTGGKPLDPALREVMLRIGAEAGLARLTWDGETVAQWSAPTIRLGRADVPLPPGGFLQATQAAQTAMTAAVSEIVGPAKRIADLFSGCGTFSLPLAEKAELHAVEGDSALLAALDTGWRGAAGLKRVTTERRDLFRSPLLADELASFDAVVIDPPRAGALAQHDALAVSDVPRIAAVSCNPATFARDAGRLVAGGYKLRWVQIVDQFRWSPHIELVAALDRIPDRRAPLSDARRRAKSGQSGTRV